MNSSLGPILKNDSLVRKITIPYMKQLQEPGTQSAHALGNQVKREKCDPCFGKSSCYVLELCRLPVALI